MTDPLWSRRLLLAAAGCRSMLEVLPRAIKCSTGLSTLGMGTALHASDRIEALPQREANIVIVGGGAAGLSAAVSASQAWSERELKKPLRIVLLEKNAQLGGDTLISGGYFNAVDSERQMPLGIKDSPSLFFEQMAAAGGNAVQKPLAAKLVEDALPALHWLERLGIVFLPTVTRIYGAPYPRAHKPALPRGTAYLRALSQAALARSVDIQTECSAQELLLDDDGRAAGLVVESKKSGRFVIKASQGIILASGGFGASTEMLQRYAPNLTQLPRDTVPSNTGAMTMAAERAGAELVDMQFVETVPGSRAGFSYPIRLDYLPERAVFVNADGRRFIDESSDRSSISAAILAQKGGAWAVADNETVKRFDLIEQKNLHRALYAGEAIRAPSLEKLSAEARLPFKALLDALNEPAVRGRIAHPPFWTVQMHLRVHATLGGIRIDEHARVLKSDGSPIPNLWAAGSCTGGIHGRNRIGGNGINTAVVFGRIAGRKAAQS